MMDNWDDVVERAKQEFDAFDYPNPYPDYDGRWRAAGRVFVDAALEEAIKELYQTRQDWVSSLGGPTPDFENASWYCTLTEAIGRVRDLKEKLPW